MVYNPSSQAPQPRPAKVYSSEKKDSGEKKKKSSTEVFGPPKLSEGSSATVTTSEGTVTYKGTGGGTKQTSFRPSGGGGGSRQSKESGGMSIIGQTRVAMEGGGSYRDGEIAPISETGKVTIKDPQSGKTKSYETGISTKGGGGSRQSKESGGMSIIGQTRVAMEGGGSYRDGEIAPISETKKVTIKDPITGKTETTQIKIKPQQKKTTGIMRSLTPEEKKRLKREKNPFYRALGRLKQGFFMEDVGQDPKSLPDSEALAYTTGTALTFASGSKIVKGVGKGRQSLMTLNKAVYGKTSKVAKSIGPKTSKLINSIPGKILQTAALGAAEGRALLSGSRFVAKQTLTPEERKILSSPTGQQMLKKYKETLDKETLSSGGKIRNIGYDITPAFASRESKRKAKDAALSLAKTTDERAKFEKILGRRQFADVIGEATSLIAQEAAIESGGRALMPKIVKKVPVKLDVSSTSKKIKSSLKAFGQSALTLSPLAATEAVIQTDIQDKARMRETSAKQYLKNIAIAQAVALPIGGTVYSASLMEGAFKKASKQTTGKLKKELLASAKKSKITTKISGTIGELADFPYETAGDKVADAIGAAQRRLKVRTPGITLTQQGISEKTKTPTFITTEIKGDVQTKTKVITKGTTQVKAPKIPSSSPIFDIAPPPPIPSPIPSKTPISIPTTTKEPIDEFIQEPIKETVPSSVPVLTPIKTKISTPSKMNIVPLLPVVPFIPGSGKGGGVGSGSKKYIAEFQQATKILSKQPIYTIKAPTQKAFSPALLRKRIIQIRTQFSPTRPKSIKPKSTKPQQFSPSAIRKQIRKKVSKPQQFSPSAIRQQISKNMQSVKPINPNSIREKIRKKIAKARGKK